jgi:hypothetical protein
MNAGGDNVLFFTISKNCHLNIPLSLTAPSQPSIYDLSTILIYNPYEKLDYTNSNVTTGYRVGLDVL